LYPIIEEKARLKSLSFKDLAKAIHTNKLNFKCQCSKESFLQIK